MHHSLYLAHATYENPVWVELDRGVIPENANLNETVKQQSLRNYAEERNYISLHAY